MRSIKLLILAASGSLGAAALSLPLVSWNDLSGRYGRHLQTPAYGGGQESVDDVLELVPLPRGGSFYFRTRAHFGGGQKCSAYGVLHQEGARLALRTGASPGADRQSQCLLTLNAVGGELVFADEGRRCGVDMCGAKGSLDGVSFPRASQRPITYLGRLRSSHEDRKAVAVDAKAHAARRP